MSESKIMQALFSALAGVVLDPPLPVTYPSVAFEPPNAQQPDKSSKDQPYLVASVLPSSADLSGIAYNSGVTNTGLLSVNVVWPAGQGVLPAVRCAEQLVRAFAPGTVLVQDGIEVKVYQQARVAPPIEGNDDVTIPVTVRWVASVPHGG